MGATVSKDGGGAIDIERRLAKARGAFLRLNKIWSSGNIGRHTKIMLFKTLVLTVLLYGCETWKLTKRDEKKIDAFQFKCLRKILKIRWHQHISNERVADMAEVEKISNEVRRRRRCWIGHVSRKKAEYDIVVALE